MKLIWLILLLIFGIHGCTDHLPIQWATVTAADSVDPLGTQQCAATIETETEIRFQLTGTYPGSVCDFLGTIKNTRDEPWTITAITIADDGTASPWTSGSEQTLTTDVSCGTPVPADATMTVPWSIRTGATAEPDTHYGITLTLQLVPTSHFDPARC